MQPLEVLSEFVDGAGPILGRLQETQVLSVALRQSYVVNRSIRLYPGRTFLVGKRTTRGQKSAS